MLKFKSLTSKFRFISIIMLAFIAAYITATYIFTRHMEGSAARIDLAARERALLLGISYNTKLLLNIPPSPERERLLQKSNRLMNEYEEILYGLRDGSTRLGVKPIHENDPASVAHIRTLVDLWENTQKPVLLNTLELPLEKRMKGCRACHSVIRENIDKVVTLPALLERHHEAELKAFDLFRVYALGFFFVASAFSAFFVRYGVVRPVERLSAAAAEIERGNFDVRADVRSGDEIGALSDVFNRMTKTLRLHFEERAEHLKEVLALANASVYLSSVPPTENIFEAVGNIAIKNFGLTMVWLGTVEEGSYDVKPVTKAGFEECYLSSMRITWDDSPTGMGPTGMAIKTRKAQVMNDIHTNPRYEPWKEEALKRGYQSSMAIPLINSEAKVAGALNLYSSEPGFFTEKRVKLFQIFANQAATAIENVRLIHGLEEKINERTRELEKSNLELLSANRELEMRRIEADGARLVAESADRAKSEFLANMSHELRTPLNTILGFSEMMAKGMAGEVTAKQVEYLDDIYESGDHLLSLINDILDLSKVEAGGLDLEYQEVDVRELFERTLMFFKEKMIMHSIQIETEIEAGVETIQADGKRIKQVLLNLLSNAVKFTPDGGSVRVAARRARAEEAPLPITSHPLRDFDFIEISVEDTGPGIKAEDIPRLFKPFQQLDSAYQKKHEGTGLGLALCKRIVELHGGEIWVESEFGRGSVFRFAIPGKAMQRVKELAAPITDPQTGILTWEYLLAHAERIISFHERKTLQFSLMRMDAPALDTPEKQAAFAKLLKKTIRKHEILAHSKNRDHYYVILLDVAERMVSAAGSRIKKDLSEKGYPVTVRAVMYPEDGRTIDGLLTALNEKHEEI